MSKNYLQEYDSAADADKYPLVQKWMKTEPLPFFKQLREERPILVTPECTLVTLFTDVRDMLQMPKIFTVDLYKPKMNVTEDSVGYLMAHDDDAFHTREKSIMIGMLNRDDLPDVRKLIAESSKNILDNANGKIEIVNQYCRMVPAIMVEEYFGLDGVDKKDLIEWSYWNQVDCFHNQPFDLNSKEKSQHITDEHDRVSKELTAYIGKLLARKLVMVKIEQGKNIVLFAWNFLKSAFKRLFGIKPEELKDTIVTRMLRSNFAKEVDFNLIRVGVNAGGLLIGSIETTSQAVSQTMEFFINRPELLKKAQAAATLDDPAEFDSMVWEALRFVPISPYMFRKASQDYSLAKGTDHETEISAGTNVLAITQSAMFDSYAYENADEFNPERNWYHHFNFGFASHECLGKYIGMVMIPEMVRQLFLKSDLQEVGSIDRKDSTFPEEYNLTWS